MPRKVDRVGVGKQGQSLQSAGGGQIDWDRIRVVRVSTAVYTRTAEARTSAESRQVYWSLRSSV